jgi:hypothetical protein
MKQLASARAAVAKRWLYTHGRPLDQRLYEYLFEGGPAAAVIAALAAYQNASGGFGHGLEPDLRTAASSVIATTQAFAVLRQVGATAGEPMVQQGIGYYLTTLEPDPLRWPIVPPAVEDAPHAPWWSYAESERTFGGFGLNPTADVVGHLWDYPELSPPALRARALYAVLGRLERLADPVEMHDLLCLLRLAEARHLPAEVRPLLEANLQRAIPAIVSLDPASWAQYGLTPLQVAPAPEARFASTLRREAVEAELDQWVETQLPDGSWPLAWHWAQVDAAAWEQAACDWKGRQIVERLVTLAAYGRLG